jgi:hypothetical protein
MGLLLKILGGLSILAGMFFVFLFPDWKEFQPDAMAYTGIMIGIILIAVGIFLIKI